MGTIKIEDTSLVHNIQSERVFIPKDKLLLLLNNAYECAYTLRNAIRWAELAPVLYSVAFTLLMTGVTTDYKDYTHIWSVLSKDRLRFMSWVVCIGCALIGTVLALFRIYKGNRRVFKERDAEIEVLMGQINSPESNRET